VRPAAPGPARGRVAARRSPLAAHARILAVVRRIPAGRVGTYGQVARLAGLPNQARLVGYALAALPSATAVPWHRVINARGEISLRRGSAGATVEQRMRLEREGVRFDAAGRVLPGHRWDADGVTEGH
jgi:methylated-DNA-protein-cysteine methyltransferase-like protein